MKFFKTVGLFFFIFLLFSLHAQADGQMPAWKDVEGVVIVVDKSRQKLFIYDGKTHTVLQEFVCTTGQIEGDKLVEGDLRTPEGVYFIEKRIQKWLDFELYGSEALVLNFPNPVDKIFQKTGYGIWIHGRGRSIVPRDTRGCVALKNENLDVVREKSRFGWTPVFIVHSLDENVSVCKEDELVRLYEQVQKWAENWSAKSEDFFAAYDLEAYNRSGKSFAAFSEQKRQLFQRYVWINVNLFSLQIACVGSYAVTSFGQFYQANGTQSEGLKRLYWRQNEDGQWKIVGEEWKKQNLGLNKIYQENRKPHLLAWFEKWRQAWISGDAEKYESFYASQAVQGKRRGAAAIAEYKKKVWEKAKPVSVELEGVEICEVADGVLVRAVQYFVDESGYKDKGMKEFLLYPAGAKNWKIIREDWKKL